MRLPPSANCARACGDIARAFVRRGEVHVENGGMRICFDGALVGCERFGGIGVIQIELPKPTESVPSISVTGFQTDAALDGFELLDVDAMIGDPQPRRADK